MTKEKARALLIQIFNTYSNIITANYKDGVIQEAFEMAIEALRRTESDSEKPNNCETCANGEGDIEACGYCRHGDLYEPKTEPFDKDTNVRSKEDCETCKYEDSESYEGACDDCTDISGSPSNYEPKTEPQTVLNDYSKADDCMECEKFFDCDAPDEVKHASRVTDCDRYAIVNDESERAYNCIGCQTDCPWK